MKLHLGCLVLASLAKLSAQDPATGSPTQTPAAPSAPPTLSPEQLAAAKAKLAAALQKAAAVRDATFALSWGPDKKGKEAEFLRMLGAGPDRFEGSWHGDLLHLKFDGDQGDELLIAGRRMIARDGQHDWTRRQRRFADGNEIRFLPDPQALLEHLAGFDLAVTLRAPAAIDDRPVEVASVTLNGEQVAELEWAGLLPPSFGNTFIFAGGGIGGRRKAAVQPSATVDVAIAYDPATSVVQQIRLRRWDSSGGPGGVFAAGGGAGAVTVVGRTGGGEDGDEEDEGDSKAAAKDAPLMYVDGLPQRPRKKHSVSDLTLRLGEQGKAKAPDLTDAQKRLLGL